MIADHDLAAVSVPAGKGSSSLRCRGRAVDDRQPDHRRRSGQSQEWAGGVVRRRSWRSTSCVNRRLWVEAPTARSPGRGGRRSDVRSNRRRCRPRGHEDARPPARPTGPGPRSPSTGMAEESLREGEVEHVHSVGHGLVDRRDQASSCSSSRSRRRRRRRSGWHAARPRRSGASGSPGSGTLTWLPAATLASGCRGRCRPPADVAVLRSSRRRSACRCRPGTGRSRDWTGCTSPRSCRRRADWCGRSRRRRHRRTSGWSMLMPVSMMPMTIPSPLVPGRPPVVGAVPDPRRAGPGGAGVGLEMEA